jgi:histidinol-phosphate aminotransferase
MTIQAETHHPAVRRCVADLAAFPPPASPATLAARLGRPIETIVKLDANENPFGPSPRVQARLSQYTTYHLYPDAAQSEGRAALAEYTGLPPEHLMLGNGADDLIDLLMRAYIDPGDEVLDFPPSFGMFAVNARLCDASVVEVPRDEQFNLDVDAALAAITPRTKLILLTSPNNPTGTVMPTTDIRRVLNAGPLVLLDEAYAEFAQADGQGYESMIRDVLTYPNLIVVRTLSKWAGLAGLRIGYAALPSRVAEHLWKVRRPFNANVAAIAAMIESLRDRDHLMGTVRTLLVERGRLLRELPTTKLLRPHPTRANFVLCDVVGLDARELHQRLADSGIIVHYAGAPLLRNRLRISVGRPDQNDALLDALHQIARDAGL